MLEEANRIGELVTGLIYINPEQDSLFDIYNLVDEPLNRLPENRLRPTKESIDELNAMRPNEGFRTVVMTQLLGDSDHSVQFRNDGGSRYEVKTPAGSGIARGTKFHVMVTSELLTRYIVTEGKVDVSGQNRTVAVTAGQLTSLVAGNEPQEPAFNISGEGEVTAIGTSWTIAGPSNWS